MTGLNRSKVNQVYDVVGKSCVGDDVAHVLLTLRGSVAVGLFKVAGATKILATAFGIAAAVRSGVHRCTW